MTEKALLQDKVDFAINGYKVDEDRYPRQQNKVASSSGNARMKADDAITLVLSEETLDDDDNVLIGDEDRTPNSDAID
jgi:hypothetical protein